MNSAFVDKKIRAAFSFIARVAWMLPRNVRSA
jgi:hypothetical protein